MFSRTASRITLASASALIAVGALAIPAAAATPVGRIAPQQNFYGQVLGTVSITPLPTIAVECVSPVGGTGETGHPLPGQSVEVQEAQPTSSAASLGYTGNSGVEINASLIDSQGGVVVATPVATFLSYDVAMPIPTSITVPCSGVGVMSFAPSPNPDNSGIPSNVNVTFESTVVVGAG